MVFRTMLALEIIGLTAMVISFAYWAIYAYLHPAQDGKDYKITFSNDTMMIVDVYTDAGKAYIGTCYRCITHPDFASGYDKFIITNKSGMTGNNTVVFYKHDILQSLSDSDKESLRVSIIAATLEQSRVWCDHEKADLWKYPDNSGKHCYIIYPNGTRVITK